MSRKPRKSISILYRVKQLGRSALLAPVYIIPDSRGTLWNQRMDEYVAKGFQTEKPITESARKAYEKVVSTGFITR